MADNPTWEGIGQGLLILALLWWAWAGYAWLTSVVDPEDVEVRMVIFGAMVALLVVSICVPGAFDDLALEFAHRLRRRPLRADRDLRSRQRR